MGEDRFIRKKTENDAVQLKVHVNGELMYLTAPLLDRFDWLRHGFSTRLGGVSTGDVGSMNLGFTREPSRENVLENYRRLCRAVGVDIQKLVLTKQTHTANVLTVHEEDAGAGIVFPRPYDDIDGLVTDVPGITLACFSADCVPLLAADPKHRAIGAAHSGWKGTVADIAGKMLGIMGENYGTKAEDVTVVIGPSICQDCYEVGEEVVEFFRDAYVPSLHDKLFYRKENGKYQLDLWEACRQNLLRAGVLEENIQVTDICTKCNPDLLFSHRALHGRQGNLGALIGICDL